MGLARGFLSTNTMSCGLLWSSPEKNSRNWARALGDPTKAAWRSKIICNAMASSCTSEHASFLYFCNKKSAKKNNS